MNDGIKKLKGQDILLLLKLLVLGGRKGRSLISFAGDLGFSQGEVSQAFKRLQLANLIDEAKDQPLRENTLEFLLHGIKYAFPATIGAIERGIPTAHSAPFFKAQIKSSITDDYVWSSPIGTIRGQTVTPIYSTVAKAAAIDRDLYELLVLIDAIRIGRAREKVIAQERLKEIISPENS